MADADADEHKRHLAFVDTVPSFGQPNNDAELQEMETAPFFTPAVRSFIKKRRAGPDRQGEPADPYPQYGLLGLRKGTYSHEGLTPANANSEDNMVYANVNAPWSAFICGSQGGGKSHTLSCLLENCLLSPLPVGALPKPLAGLVFHYDKFTSSNTTQLCEAAYLCSSAVPVRVLVSPSNYHNMARLYSNLPGLAPQAPQPTVMPLYLQERQLNISNMKTLMAVNDKATSSPLYLEVLFQILRDMALEAQGRPGVDYRDFKNRLESATFSRDQSGPLKLRLQLLESFLDPRISGRTSNIAPSSDIWNFEPGSLTIVDLSDPFVKANDACALFSICLTLFMESRGQGGRIIALDEAHKFLTQSGEALDFTEDLLSLIRQQRHLATRVLIASQEPTLSPALIDLCNVTVVHRFLSPAWFETLKKHLAGAGATGYTDSRSVAEIFRTIVSLQTGEALLFSPTALLDIGVQDSANTFAQHHLEKLKDSYIKLRIRKRITADGGKDIMASEAVPASKPEPDSEGGSLLGSEASGTGSRVFPMSVSRFGPPAAPGRQQQPPSQHQRQHPVRQQQSQGPLPVPQPQSKQKKATTQATLPTRAQLQPQQAPAQQLTKRQKKALNQAAASSQSKPHQGTKQATKTAKKALQQMTLTPRQNRAAVG